MKTIHSLLGQLITVLVLAYHGFAGQVLAANTYDAAVITHPTTVKRTNDAAVTARHLLWAQGAGAGTVAVATATTPALGTIDNTETATGVAQTVNLLGKGDTKKMVASGIITVGTHKFVYQDAAGKVSATGTICVGVPLTSAGADNDIIEVQDMPASVAAPTTINTALAVAGAVLAIPVTHRSVNKTTGGVEALTLADGTFIGQRINILLIVDGGDGTLTPATPWVFLTIVFADKGDSAEFEWTASGWRIIGLNGVAAPPVITVA